MQSDLPLSALHYVIRTRERVVLDDASIRNLYSEDEYVREKLPRSVICLAIVKQTKLIGALYLENNLTPRAFTSDKVAVLEMLASQAAISLENANLWSELRESEKSVRLIVDGIAGIVAIMTPEGEVEFVNQQGVEYFGRTLEELKGWATSNAVHPDDLPQAVSAWTHSVATGDPYAVDHRLRRADGAYRWFHSRGLALRDANGRIVRWYNLLTDIDERRRAEEKLRNENVALREEIDKASMFEEIVGISPALHAVLSRVSKVAPTDSTVLINSETGTGKELIARAVHTRSQRSSRAFVGVNCAAVPRDLIASELFGHEKGGCTGATQRRLGRFELAEGGTIFLDEVGELPADTQVALLRVLQEREFERVGGTGSIRTNVRVIAATNRNLQTAMANGTFRSDL